MDCIEAMREMEDGQFDLAIVDPPYGVNLTGGRGNNGWAQKEYWDKARKGWNLKCPDSQYFDELFRISNSQIIWGGNYFVLPPTQCWLIWDKGQRGFSLADGEMAWTSFNKAMRIKTIHRGTANAENKIHPTQKPIILYKWLLQNCAKEGDKILDTHAGSFSIGIACWDMGYDLEAYEIDKEYYDKAVKRFNTHCQQKLLF